MLEDIRSLLRLRVPDHAIHVGLSGLVQALGLLASFMPVISAVSSNVGLQAAAIAVRALDERQTLKSGGAALLKEISTTVLMAVVCGVVLAASARSEDGTCCSAASSVWRWPVP